MKMADFKVLPQSEQLTMLNKHLTSIKGLDGRLEDNFKGGIFDFSYSLWGLVRIMRNYNDKEEIVPKRRFGNVLFYNLSEIKKSQ